MTDDSELALSSEEVTALREVLTDHEVRFAMVFGSAGRPRGDLADVDLAVEFAEYRPTDDGYADRICGFTRRSRTNSTGKSISSTSTRYRLDSPASCSKMAS